MDTDPTLAQALLVWERPEPEVRPVPAALSRSMIIDAAIAIADREGLGAATIRKVAGELGVGPMRLYNYVSAKEELLELMVDVVYGEMAELIPTQGDWRDVLRAVATEVRAATTRHPWFVELLGGRPHLGPNALLHLERSLGGLMSGSAASEIEQALVAFRAVTAFAIGALRLEASEIIAERETGIDEEEWRRSVGPYLQRVLAGGEFPHLEQAFADADPEPADAAFASGLDCLLDGLGLRIFDKSTRD